MNLTPTDLSCDPAIVGEMFLTHSHVEAIQWDGVVHVNGKTVGDPAIFEPLWDYFVETPHGKWTRKTTTAPTSPA